MKKELDEKFISRESLYLKVFSNLKKSMDHARTQKRRIPGYLGALGKLYRLIQPQGIVQTEIQGLKLCLDMRDEVIAHGILAYGHYEPEETKLLKDIVTPGMTMLDVGANLGYFSLLVSKQLADQCKIYSFEPDPHNAGLLRRNVELNQAKSVEVVQKAVSNKPGTVLFFKDESNYGGHSLGFNNLPGAEADRLEVETVTLNDFCSQKNLKVDLIKMDVQGYEGFVFEGASEVLKQSQLKMLIEFWPFGLEKAGAKPLQVIERLLGYGFCVKMLSPNGLVDLTSPEDIVQRAREKDYINLFLTKEK